MTQQNDAALIELAKQNPKFRTELLRAVVRQASTDPATPALIQLAKENPVFRRELLAEVVASAENVNDYAIDEFSQHNMLRNLRGGDLIEMRFAPHPLHPQRIATRLVASDFDPAIPGVLLKGLGMEPEILADRGQGQPLIWEPGAGEPAIPVLELRRDRAKLKLAQEDEGKPTAAQVQFAMDLAKEKGKDLSKSDLQSKSKAEVSKLIDEMQKEKTKASEKQISYALDLLKADGRSSPNKSSLEKMSEVEISKLIDGLKKKNKTAQAILEHLGGEYHLATMVGAREILFRPEGLSFEWPNMKKENGNKVIIMRAMASEGYNVHFLCKTASGEQDLGGCLDVPGDELAGAFEKHTGWFLRL